MVDDDLEGLASFFTTSPIVAQLGPGGGVENDQHLAVGELPRPRHRRPTV